MGMFEDHQEWASRLAWKYARERGYHTRLTIEQVQNAGLIALWKLIERYQPSRGPFRRFAYSRIVGAVSDEWRSHSQWHSTKSHRPEVVSLTMFQQSPRDDERELTLPARDESGPTEARLVLLDLFETVSRPRTRQIMRLLMHGWTMREIGEIYGCSEANVFQIVKKIKTRLRSDYGS